jgi:DnaJ-domain-containing protein 1
MPGKLVNMVSTLGRRCWDGLKNIQHPEPEMPAGFGQPSDLSEFQCRARIGREGRGDSWRSVLVVDICGTIQAPEEGYEIDVRIELSDATDQAGEPLPILDRPKHGPLNPSAHFFHQTDMGRLCRRTTVLQDWTTVAQLSTDWFVLPRRGQRQLKYTTAIVSRATGEQLARASCLGTYENIETGYLDIEEDIQRVKSLAVGLAFTIGAANGQLLDPEVSVIGAWVKTNFGSTEVSEGARQEIDRALQKTTAFFRRGGALDVAQICREIIQIAPLVGRLDVLDLCLRVAAAKGQVTAAELKLLKEMSEGLQIDRDRLRAMVAKTLPVEMHQTKDAEMIFGVTGEMSKDEARHQLNREYAKWSSRVISSDPAIRRQADQMIRLIADARVQYVSAKPAE